MRWLLILAMLILAAGCDKTIHEVRAPSGDVDAILNGRAPAHLAEVQHSNSPRNDS